MKYQFFLHYRPNGDIVTFTMYSAPQPVSIVSPADGCRIIGVDNHHPAVAEPEHWRVVDGKVKERV